MAERTQKTRREFFSDLARPKAAAGALTTRTGRHGEKVSLLGYGAMRLPTIDGGNAAGRVGKPIAGSSKADIDQKTLNAQVDYMLAHGINYFDTSPVYCMGRSERVTGIALSRHPRASYFLATKLSNFNAKFWPLAKCKEMFEESLKNLQTDYIDFYLMHAIGNGGMETFSKRYLENGALDWLLEERKAGRIRNLGR